MNFYSRIDATMKHYARIAASCRVIRGAGGWFVLVLVLAGAVPSAAADDDWMRRPEIREIRALYAEVEHALNAGELSLRTREFEYCQPAYLTRSLYLDAVESARLYVLEGGSEDSARTNRYYYDREERLRFVFAVTRAVNLTTLEERIYVGTAGEVLHHDHRLVEGPGWSRSEIELVDDPQAHFASAHPCPEITPKPDR